MVELVNEGEGYSVQVLDAVAAQSRFEKYVRFFKNSKVGETVMPVPTTISEATAKQYLKTDACRNVLPRLNGVLHCPVLIEKDGQLHTIAQGYDETTGFFVTTADQPANYTCEEAVQMLPKLLRDFDFVTAGDRSRAIASFLTPALKLGGLIQGPVPVDVAEANASQSGKRVNVTHPTCCKWLGGFCGYKILLLVSPGKPPDRAARYKWIAGDE